MDYEKVYKILKSIPKGKVTTYKAIADKLGISPRFVGYILSRNEHPGRYPCYKVVRSDGYIGGYTVYGKNNTKTRNIKRYKLLMDKIKLHGYKVDKAFIIKEL